MTKCYAESCGKKFGVFTKEYTCVSCTQSFCKQCSVKTVTFPKYSIVLGQRVCNACVKNLTEEGDGPVLKLDLSRGSVIASAESPDSSINKELEEMMEEQQLNPQARDRMRAMDLSIKYQMLNAYRAANTNKKSNDPHEAVESLGNNGRAPIWNSPEQMQKLCMCVKTESKTWSLQFVRAGGMQALLEGLVACTNNAVRILGLEAIFSFVRTSTGLESFLQYNESILALASFILTDTDEVKCITAHIFAYICSALDENAYPIVCSALATPIFAQTFVKMLQSTESMKLAMNLMILLNAMVNNADMSEDRLQLRMLFQQHGLDDAMSRLKMILDTKYNGSYSNSKSQKQYESSTYAGYPSTPGRKNANSIDDAYTPAIAGPSVVGATPIVTRNTAPSVSGEPATPNPRLQRSPSFSHTQVSDKPGEAESPHVQLVVQIELYEAAIVEDSQELDDDDYEPHELGVFFNLMRKHVDVADMVIPRLLTFNPNILVNENVWKQVYYGIRALSAVHKSDDICTDEMLEMKFNELIETQGQAGGETGMSIAEVTKYEGILAEKSKIISTQEDKIKALETEKKTLATELEKAKTEVKTSEEPRAPEVGGIPRPPNPLLAGIQGGMALKKAGDDAPARPVNPMLAGIQGGVALKKAGDDAPARPVNPMLAGIQGGVALKKADGDAPARPVNPMLAGIQGGVALKKAGDDAPARPVNPMLAGIQGGVALKKADGDAPARPVNPMLAGIQGGVALKKADGDAPARPVNPMLAGIQGGMALKKAGEDGPRTGTKPAAAAVEATPEVVVPEEDTFAPYKRRDVKPAQKLRGIHWAPLETKVLESTVWMKMNDQDNVKLETKEIEELFGMKAPEKKLDTGAADGTPTKAEKKQLTSFLDAQKGQNMTIALSRMKLTNDEIVTALRNCDLTVLNADRLNILIKWFPSSEELESLSCFDGPPSDLAAGDLFYYTVFQTSKIARLRLRIDTMLFNLQFEAQYTEINDKVQTCIKSLEQIGESKALKRVLELVLAIGNYLNAGTRKGNAFAFDIRFLNKLQDTKTVDTKSNLLNYLVTMIDKDEVAKNIAAEIDNVSSSSKVDIMTLLQDMRKFSMFMKKTEQEVTTQRKSPSDTDKYLAVMESFYEKSNAKVLKLQETHDSVAKLAATIAKSFGETPQNLPADQLFILFDEFLGKVSTARAGLERARLAKEREEKRNAAKASSPTPAATNSIAKPTSGGTTGATAGGKDDHLNQLQAAMLSRMQKSSVPATIPESKPAAEAELDKQVTKTLTGANAQDVMKEIAARRAMRNATMGTKRLFGPGALTLPTSTE